MIHKHWCKGCGARMETAGNFGYCGKNSLCRGRAYLAPRAMLLHKVTKEDLLTVLDASIRQHPEKKSLLDLHAAVKAVPFDGAPYLLEVWKAFQDDSVKDLDGRLLKAHAALPCLFATADLASAVHGALDARYECQACGKTGSYAGWASCIDPSLPRAEQYSERARSAVCLCGECATELAGWHKDAPGFTTARSEWELSYRPRYAKIYPWLVRMTASNLCLQKDGSWDTKLETAKRFKEEQAAQFAARLLTSAETYRLSP